MTVLAEPRMVMAICEPLDAPNAVSAAAMTICARSPVLIIEADA